VVLGSLLVVALAYPYVGGTDLARRLCGASGLGLFESFNMRKAQEYRRQAIAARLKSASAEAPSWREQRFTALMRQCRPYGVGRAALGALYERLGAYPAKILAGQTLGPLIFVLLFCYGMAPGKPALTPMMQGSLADFAFIGAGMVSLGYTLPLTFTLPLPLGRRERFLATLAGLTVLCLVTVVILALMALCSHALAPFMPTLTFKSLTLPYRAMNPRCLVVAVLVFPLGALCRTFLRDNLLRILPIMILMPTAWLWMPAFAAQPWSAQAGLVVGTWAIALALLGWHCARRDLSVG
jgi:hypothetical protein